MESRKRALESLERRFAAAKAELETLEQKNKKRKVLVKEGDAAKVGHSSEGPDVAKGHISFVGYTSRKDMEDNEPAYLSLSHEVNKDLLPSGVKVADRRSSVNNVLHDLFQHGDSVQKYMQGSKSMKIGNSLLLDNYVQKSSMFGDSSLPTLKTMSKRSKKHFSLKKHKKNGSLNLPQEFHNYEMFMPMHKKWRSYIAQLIKIVGKDQLAQCFLNADLHGAIILVVDCKLEAYAGVHGIMIRETRETFGIITRENKFRAVPKKLSVFLLQADGWKITLLGDQLAARSMTP